MPKLRPSVRDRLPAPIYIIIMSDDQIRNRVCLEPFGNIEIDSFGNVRLCGCASWMPIQIGNIFKNTIEELLASKLAINIRNSIRDGSYRYCNKNTCGFIANDWLLHADKLNDQDVRVKLFKDETMPKTPVRYFIAGDRTCNLSCPSCRTHVIANHEIVIEQNKQIVDILNKQLFSGSTNERIFIHVSTSGEVFASPLLLSFLENFSLERYPRAVFRIQTNGLLLKRRWHRIEFLKDHIENITVTTDSCTKNVYEKLRRGGIFEDLIENLEFLSTLNVDFNMRMVVQKDNYNEIENFYHWSKQFGATQVEYTRLTNWGTFTNNEFLELDVLNPKHSLYDKAVEHIHNLRNRYNDILLFGFNC